MCGVRVNSWPAQKRLFRFKIAIAIIFNEFIEHQLDHLSVLAPATTSVELSALAK